MSDIGVFSCYVQILNFVISQSHGLHRQNNCSVFIILALPARVLLHRGQRKNYCRIAISRNSIFRFCEFRSVYLNPKLLFQTIIWRLGLFYKFELPKVQNNFNLHFGYFGHLKNSSISFEISRFDCTIFTLFGKIYVTMINTLKQN